MERVACHQSGDIRGDRAARRRFVDDDEPTGVLEALVDGLVIERREGARVDEIGGDAVGRECIERLLGERHHTADRDHRDMLALAHERRFAERDRVVALRDRAFARVERLVLEEHHRVVVADRREHQALGIVGVGGHDHLEARHGGDQRVHRLAVLRAHVHASAGGGADDDGAGGLAAEHVAELRGLVEDLIEAHTEEIREHELGHRTHAGERRAIGGADDRGLGDRGVDHAVLAELRQQAFGDPEHPARRVALAGGAARAARDILAEDDHAGIACHLEVQGLVDRIAHGKLSHVSGLRAARGRQYET